jgi:hypothetical protein
VIKAYSGKQMNEVWKPIQDLAEKVEQNGWEIQ